ncbi:MAG: carbohydrate ABC transporter permease [Erysipelothrix sp.]|nr:carbohydrate ABC transporter permease [Erysipelothrix sp.]
MKRKTVNILTYIFLISICLIWMFPMIYGLTTSFKSQTDIMSVGFKLLPVNWILDNYVKVITNTSSAPILKWFLNSMVISISHSFLVIIIVSLASYGYTRMEFRGRDILFYIILGISMFPGVVNLIPSYKIVQKLGWINTPLSVIVPGLAGVGNVFLVRQFMMDIPRVYDESARIDGASDFFIYFKIILPLVRPVLIVVGLFSFIGSWNDFLWPSIVINDVSKLPITAGLQLLQDIYGNYVMIGQLMASAVIAMIPTTLLFIFAQKYFMESLNIGAGIK